MLALYWVGLAVFHYTAFNQKRVHPNSATATPRNEVSIQLWMSIPFAIPFLAFTLLFDALQFIPNAHFQEAMKNGSDDVLISIVLMVGMLAFMVLTMIFLPALIQKLWRCEPLEEGPLKDRLEALCRKANFKHAGMKTWTLLNDALTAAIIGIVPRYRYVMFTKRILHELPPESIEAILAHEIGHSYRKHLLIYPGIIMGMFIFASIFFLSLEISLTLILWPHTSLMPLFWPSISALFSDFFPEILKGRLTFISLNWGWTQNL